MLRLSTFIFLLGIAIPPILAQGYAVGDKVASFTLKNVDEQMVSLSDYTTATGVIVVFTCNHCPYAKAYEQRIMDLANTYAAQGFPLVAINPNDPNRVPEDDFANMQARAKEKGYSFPYLVDATQEVARAFGATKTPHTYLLENGGKEGFTVRYIGAIDDSPMDATAVEQTYLANAIAALTAGEAPTPDETKAIGCTIKWLPE